MSYDLFFTARAGKKLDKKSFAAHFAGRANYHVENGQALYQNEDTGLPHYDKGTIIPTDRPDSTIPSVETRLLALDRFNRSPLLIQTGEKI